MKRLRRLAEIGFIGVGFIVAGLVIASIQYQGREGESFSLLNHFVSELGEKPWSKAYWAFNYGLIFGGGCFFVFVAMLKTYLQGIMGRVIVFLGFATSISGILVGFFPMNILKPHYMIAMVFFYSGMGMTVMFSLYVLFSYQNFFPELLSLPGLVSFISFFSFLFLTDPFSSGSNISDGLTELLENRPAIIVSAILEWAVVLTTLLWITLMSMYILQRSKNKADVLDK